ncbi:carbohydrate-binding domain-containing protein [Dyadobacter psychrotolerans]|uniref:Carbohydrate-binding domain-containing protein n=1 Tax=Dyadobacter psychrotolerans TaxID=2541721 RepID=A0A4R5E0R7_9BACT|nr:carbohydrate-binding domain-containing protein [Dyadobacter psychrotolerans]TDE17395.1 carbohydrate-binding domain-containing protein [Dyadobacter psychrotolerans]
MTSIKRLKNPLKNLASVFCALSLIVVVSLTSCSKEKDEVEPGTDTGSSAASVVIDSLTQSAGIAEGNTGVAANADDLLASATFSSKVTIVFGTTITMTNPMAAAGVTITEVNGDVTVKSTASDVEYEVSGTTTNGSVKIYSDKKIKLTLNGANITNADGPAINVQSSKRVFLVLADNTTNTLTDGATYTASGTEDMKATLFSEGQLVFSGAGTLNVKGNYKHAICSDEYVRIISGNVTVTGAVSDGIHTNDAFIADGGIIKITTAGDGIQCEEGYIVINNGTFTINVADKGIAATWDTDATIDPYLTINGGTINITSTAGEGIESKSIMTINNGTITTKTTDDGLNAGTFIYINGGNIYAYSTSNDAIDSNGKITITGGKIVAVGSTAPEEGFDCDKNTFKVTGGILVGVAGATSSPTASVSTQASVLLGSGSANLLYHIQSSDGKEALTFLIPRNYATMLFSSPKLKSSGTYRVYTGGSVAGGSSFGGLYTSGTYNVGTQASTFTTTSMVTKIGGSVGPG